MVAAPSSASCALIVTSQPALRLLPIIAGAVLLTTLLSLTTLFQRIELWLDDTQQSLVAREMSFSQTLLVDIDEESLRRLEPYLGPWPYRRDIFALATDFLGELGARAVCFDVLMSERRPGDRQLAKAVERNPSTVFAAVALSYPLTVDETRRALLDRLSWTVPAELKVESWADFNLPVIAETLPAINGAEVGIASLWPDIDGSVRRIPLFHRAQGAVLPALAVATTIVGSARANVEYEPGQRALRVNGHIWPIDDSGRAALSFPRNADAVKSIPFHVLALAAMGASKVPAELNGIKGRTVIIGSTALQTDAVHTPRGLMPGAYLLAVAHENLANDLLLQPADRMSAFLLLALALTAPIGWSMRRRANPAGIGAALLAGTALAYAANLAVIYGWQRHSPLLFTLSVLLLVGCGQLAMLAVAELRRRRHAENQMQIASAVFAASREGVFVTDAQDRIVSINPAFTAITGYTESEALGQNPSLLNSGRHDAEFRRAMWRSILNEGYWQGEIWNRRKSGEIFPEWLSINTITGPDGSVDKRIAVFSDLSGDKAAAERISFLANFDPLTRLPNRALFRDRVTLALAAAARAQAKVTLMLIDLDRFKNIVDSLGHDISDRILQQVAERLQDLLDEGDTASRLGGDEFILLLPGADADATVHLADRILKTIALPYLLDDNELSLTASIGIAEFPENGHDHDALSRSADSALYRAKQAGRNNFQFYAAEMHQRANELLLLENDLRHAVERDELILHYQPQVDAKTGKLVGLEALLRWRHPTRGLISPARFIPIAEESGLIVEIGDWVLHGALEQMRAWKNAGLSLVPVAVNVSLAQFRQATLCNRLIDALQASGIDAALLELELTESVAMEDIAFTIDTIDRMRQLGIGLSIDDFGTGYSSLAYLKRFSVHKIKIDQSFIRNLSDDKEDASIVRAIIGLAHNLGFKVIAEGVETPGQRIFLCNEACDEIQGFHFSRPLPACKIAPILQRGTLTPASEPH